MLAGAAGTVALNVTTNLDMAIRGRPSSSVPATVASRMTEMVGINVGESNTDSQDSTAQNRHTGMGALLGYVTGLGIGAAYGLFRTQVDRPPRVVAGIGLGLLAMAGSDGPATGFGVTNPKTWGPNSWLSDIIPHMVYGFVTATAYESLPGR